MSKSPAPKAFLAQRLRQLRKRAGLTQEGFAERTGFSYKVYQSMEAGRRWNLRMSTILRLAEFYGLTLSELFAKRCPAVQLKNE